MARSKLDKKIEEYQYKHQARTKDGTMQDQTDQDYQEELHWLNR